MDYISYIHDIERDNLSPYAKKSFETKGRERLISGCNLRTEFQRDRDRILHCKAFRRLKHKTQVFLSPEGDHYRTRLTHTLEVSQIARTIARALKLNEDLVEAISLGHDLGHTPFGHAGERALDDIMKSYGGQFRHSDQSLRMVDVLEYDGKGLNLTYEVRNGIANHTRQGSPETLEGRVVQLSDQIAYLNHDIDDAVRANILNVDDIPKSVTDKFGSFHGIRINNMILDIIKFSHGKPYVEPSPSAKNEIENLRNFMFENVYFSHNAKEQEPKAKDLLTKLYNYYFANESELPQYIKNLNASLQQKVCDYIATMTDTFAIRKFSELFIPKCWHS